MPLQNRVDPFGNLFADTARGTFMGNRGGRIHDAKRELTRRRWASRQWICCVLSFKARRRTVWGEGYTELFFLDEPTALAAGHRPCFECRRVAALAFARAFAGVGPRLGAAAMDRVLQAERLDGRDKRLHRAALDTLPDGAFIARDGIALAVRGKGLLRWTPSGYRDAERRPHGVSVDVLTPPSIVHALANGYQPSWHVSAECLAGDML
jgi:hypothetical protein